MGVFFSDEFVGTNGTLLPAHSPDVGTSWTKNPGSEATQDIELSGSGLASAKADINERVTYYADAPSDSSLYRTEGKLIHTGGGDVSYDAGVTVRQLTVSERSYRTAWSNNAFKLMRATTANNNTTLATFTGAAVFDTSGQFAILKLEAEGTTLRGSVTDPLGDVYTAEVIDSVNATGGRPGIWCLSRNFKCDFDYFIASDGPVVVSGLTLTSVTPTTGPSTGGTTVTMTGTGFEAGTVPKFNGVAAASVVIVSPTELTCVTPAL